MTSPSTARLACTLAALLLAPAAQAAPPATTEGTAHFLIVDAQDAPIAGATLAGACEARLGPFWNAEKLLTRWSCTSDADGVCSARIATLAQPDGKPVECRGTERSTLTEKGASAARISYHAFFPKGVGTSHTLLKKGTAWKDGEYLFKAIPNQAAFESVAHRYRIGHYAQRMRTGPAPGGQGTLLSTQAAHHQESADFQNLTYLSAVRGGPAGAAAVRVSMVLTYVDYTFHRYATARFDGAAGPQTAALTAQSDKTTCNLRDLMERKCTYREDLEFTIDAALARQLAGRYAAQPHGNWVLRIASAQGHERSLPVAYAELAALVAALDAPAQR
ncbi:hypothetical protein [Comamonas granuli]|uniref:hypothetical protein n=1 Tax=Comamonas granuli TaxID=290309 RepID=UPI0012EC8CE5|nr:hypothetical protein [Comamonas granuli]